MHQLMSTMAIQVNISIYPLPFLVNGTPCTWPKQLALFESNSHDKRIQKCNQPDVCSPRRVAATYLFSTYIRPKNIVHVEHKVKSSSSPLSVLFCLSRESHWVIQSMEVIICGVYANEQTNIFRHFDSTQSRMTYAKISYGTQWNPLLWFNWNLTSNDVAIFGAYTKDVCLACSSFSDVQIW